MVKEVVVKERMMSGSTKKITVDAQAIWKPVNVEEQGLLYRNLAAIFRMAYAEGALRTDDYSALCEIAIKECPAMSTKAFCGIQMTADRVIMILEKNAESYEEKIKKCFEKVYLGEKQ